LPGQWRTGIYLGAVAACCSIATVRESIALHGMAWAEFLGTSTCGGSGGFDLDPPFRLRSIFLDFLSPAILRIGRTYIKMHGP
jgi:hypothetical protein